MRREKWGWHAVDLGVEMGEVGAVHRREKEMRRKMNRDANGFGGGPPEVSQNKLEWTKNLGP
jgi:hypothetical protein